MDTNRFAASWAAGPAKDGCEFPLSSFISLDMVDMVGVSS